MKTPADLFLSLLPASQRDRAKAYLAAGGSAVAAALPLVPHVPEGVGVFMAVLVGLGVFAMPNGKLTPAQQALADRVAEVAEEVVPVVESVREAVVVSREEPVLEPVLEPVVEPVLEDLTAPLEVPVPASVTAVVTAPVSAAVGPSSVPGKVSLYQR